MALEGLDEDGREELYDKLYGAGAESEAKAMLKADMERRGLRWEEPDA